MTRTNNFDDKKRIKQNGLPEKQFAIRNSLLIDLFENDHFQTIYHIFLTLFLILIINTSISDYLKTGEIYLGLQLIRLAFGKFHWTFIGWLATLAYTCSAYFLFSIWAKFRTADPKKAGTKNALLWDKLWLAICLIYYITGFTFATKFVMKLELRPASAVVVVMEMPRFLMKVHAFIRANAEKVIKFKPHTEKELELPTFKYFVYFLFIPTLIYRDSYPYTKKIRWRFVFYRLIEMVMIVFFFSFVYGKFLLPTLLEYGDRKFTVNELIMLIFESSMVGILMLLLAFFCILHSCQNLFAELLMFGDRMFYKDWWTSTNLAEYFRTWNVVVHDWLYTYIYKDTIELLNVSTVTGKSCVFILSAIIHEWIAICMTGFFFPLLFIEFFCAFLLNFINAPKLPILNVLFLYSLSFGCGSLIAMYSIEFISRMKFPLENPTFIQSITPRFLTCDCIDYN